MGQETLRGWQCSRGGLTRDGYSRASPQQSSPLYGRAYYPPSTVFCGIPITAISDVFLGPAGMKTFPRGFSTPLIPNIAFKFCSYTSVHDS